MARSTYDINPSVWSKDELSTAFGNTEADADLETAANYKENLHLSSKSWRRLISQSRPSSYLFPEIELSSLVTDFMEHRQMWMSMEKTRDGLILSLGTQDGRKWYALSASCLFLSSFGSFLRALTSVIDESLIIPIKLMFF